jgi:methyltransferase (TIGR00027 family)
VEEGKPSWTAMQVAACRAAHLRFDPEPHLLDDRFAEPLLGPDAEGLIGLYASGGHWILQENRIFLPFRARFAEDLVADAYRAGVQQLVVLGAGLDSFALRRPAALSALRVFEVDHPATQRWKRERLARLGIAEPGFLTFAECDFETTSVSSALRRTAFRPDLPAVVSWMGVVYYLSAETARRALVELAQLLAPGSAIALDYQVPLDALPQRYRDVHAQMSGVLNRVGEPQVNRYRPDEIRDELIGAGFARTDLPTRAELYHRYFEPLGSPIPMSERFGIAVGWR